MQEAQTAAIAPFQVQDCAQIAIALGRQAHNLRELRDQILTVPEGAVFTHFWMPKLRPGFEAPEFLNDFASWAQDQLHDNRTAEKLALVNPMDYAGVEELRVGLLEVVEDCLFENELVHSVAPGDQFNFISSKLVVLDTGLTFQTPEQLAKGIAGLPLGSVFYHVIDARRRSPEGLDDFSAWLAQFGGAYADTIASLAGVDRYFCTLTELRSRLASAFAALCGGAS